MNEEWKPIKGYEGLYEVSNQGRVRSLGRIMNRRTRWGNISEYKVAPRIMTPKPCQGGYLFLNLFDTNGVRKMHKVHRLVAEAFLPKIETRNEVNHKDEDKTNNCVDNLEWVNHKENCNHGTRNERSVQNKQKRVSQLTLDGAVVNIYSGCKEASKLTGISRTVLYNCLEKRYGPSKDIAYGYRWEYTDKS